MRNLKKLFAVVMIVAMLASMMVPALAAGVEYDDEAGILQDLNLFQGYGAGNLGLEDDLTREQGLALMLRVMGLEEEVKAMTEEEIAEGLAKVTDPETITDTWAKPYVAYAVLNGLTNGIDASTLPNVKFAGQLKMNGQEFINLMLNGMGYRTAWDDVLAKAAEVEILSAGEAVTFGTIKEMKRDQAVAIMYNALTGITSEGILLAQALVDAGAVDADKMLGYGFIEEEEEPVVEPEELEATATADNLVQLYVEFNTEVDKDSAEDKDNYDINKVKIADAALQDDGVTVVLTFDAANARKQQDVIDLVIDGVKDLDGNKIVDYTIEDIEFIDTTIPTAIDAEVVGSNTFKVIFSEPMKGDVNKLKKSDFSVNGGKSYVKEVTLQKNGTEALVKMYNELKEGEVTLQVKSGSEDFAGFGVIGKLFTLEVVPDEEAPVVIGYEKASRDEVTLIWNEDIEENGKIDRADYYHTNAKNKVQEAEGDAVPVKIDGNKMTLYFDDDSLMPFGISYVYVLKEAVRDLWNNKNAQEMIQIEIEVDETPPAVDKIDVKAEDKIEITYTENVEADSAKKKANYTILKDGDEVKNVIDKVTHDAGKKVTITFDEKLSGDYAIAIEKVEDKAGNKIVSTTVEFNVGDKTAPDPSKFKATLYNGNDEDQMIRVDFDDVMATDGKYSVIDIENYVIVKPNETGKEEVKLEKIKEVEFEVVDDGKAVEIYIPSSEDVKDNKDAKNKEHYFDFLDSDDNIAFWIQIARVADAADNKIDVMSKVIEVKASDVVGIKEVKATGRDVIEITFTDQLYDFEAEDIIIEADAKEWKTRDIAGVDTKVKDGRTIAVITLDDEETNLLNYDATYGKDSKDVVVKIVEEPKSETRYGKKLDPTATKIAEDKIKPALYDDGKDSDYAKVDEDAGKYVKDYLNVTVTDDTYFDATIFFSEKIEVLGGNLVLAGSELVITLDGDSLVNMKDYEVIEVDEDANGVAYLTIRFKGEDVKDGDDVIGQKFEGDLEIGLAESLEYITDDEDNVIEKFDPIEVDNLELKNYEEEVKE